MPRGCGLSQREVTAQLAHIHYDVINEGAIGDGITDDTLAIQKVFDTTNDGDAVFFPKSSYRTTATATITVTKAIQIVMDGVILADHSNIALLMKDDSSNGSFHPNYHNRYKINGKIRIVRVGNKGYEMEPTAVGLEIWNVFSAKLYLDEIEKNHIGLKMIGDKYGSGYGGTTYCNIAIGVINSYKENIVLEASAGYVTQNQFYSGSLTGGNNDIETIHLNMKNIGTSVINENTLFGVSFEGGFKKAVKGLNATNNKFISCRYEMPNITHLFDFEESRGNEFDNSSYVANHMSKNLFNDNSTNEMTRTNTKVRYYDYRYGSIEYYDRIFYIKPNRSPLGRVDYTVNSVSLSVPKEWDIRIITQGLSHNRINSVANNTSENILSIDIRLSDVIDVRELSEHPFWRNKIYKST